MAIEKKLICFARLEEFKRQLAAGNILDYSIVFIQDAKMIWSRGTYYDCKENVQSDWAQEDSAEDNYIKNRTHYYSVSDHVGQFVTVSKEVGDVLFEGLSEGAFYTIINNTNDSKRYSFQFVTGRKINIPFNGPTVEAVCGEDGSLVLASTTYGIAETFSVHFAVVKQLDDIYIPETIARKEEVVKKDDGFAAANGLMDDDDAYFALPTRSEGFTDSYILATRADIKDANVYVTDFTVYDLEYMHDNPEGAMQFDVRSLYAAFASHKVVLVPYGEGSAGYSVATGYQDDFLYVSIMLEDGRRISLEIPNIDDNAIYPENIYIGTLAYEGNLKTINGESIVGSGNIVISGGSGGGSGAYSEVNHGTSDTTFTLTPNTFHVWDEVSSLTLGLGSETSGVANEFLFQFTSGATATSLTLPDDIKWANDTAPTIAENMIYQVSVLKGLASVLSWENTTDIQLVRFTIDGVPYNAEDGMTWEVWCESPYNTGGFSIIFPNVQDKNGNYVCSDTNGSYVYFNNPIYINSYTTVYGPTGGE